MRQRLTNISIRRLPHPEQGNTKHWDTTTPGFGVRVTAGTKSFVVMYGKERRLKTIGRYPEISLSEARTEAKRLLALKPRQNASQPIFGLIKAYLDECEARLRPSSVKRYREILERTPDVRLEDAKKAWATTSHEIAAYKAFFNWCIREGYTKDNPFMHMTAKYGKRDRVLSSDELIAVSSRSSTRSYAMRLLSKKEVRAKTTYSPAHIDRLEKAGQFPSRVRLGQNRVAWVESEVDAWIEARISDRDLSAGP